MVPLLLMAGLSFVSCSDDGDGGSAGWNTGGSSLVGTTWKYNYSDYHYAKKREGGGLRFLSSTTVLVLDWEYEYNDTEYVEDIVGSYTYEYSSPNGVIYVDGSAFSFIVSGNKMTLYAGEEGTIVLTRE